MERTGLSDLLSNETTGQGEFPGNGLASLMVDPTPQKAPAQAEDATGGGTGKGGSVSMPPSASVAEFVKNAMPAAQRVAKRLNVPVEAVIGQWGLETGWGKSVIPGTNNLGNIKDFRGGGVSAKDNANGKVDKYRQYGSVDEFAEDFANLLGNTNYKAVPGTKDAQAYFAALKAARYAEDPDYVAKGTSAARMVAEAMGKSGQGSTPDLSKAPKWSDITGKPEFKALSDAEKAEAKKAYFDYWVAPHAGDQADALREQFMAKSDEPGWGQRLSEGLDDLNKRAADAIKGVFTKEPSALERPNADVPKNEAASMAPVRPEVRAQFNAIWDSATPQQREAMAQQPGWRGMLARERAGIYSQPGAQLTQIGQQFDPRVESRREALISKGEDARAADTFARMGARQGIQPGLEVAKLGGVQASEFDFDTKQAFGDGPANGLNNVLARGLTKGALGFGKAITGYGEFLSDVYGLDETGNTMREGSKWARGKEEAIGQRGTFLERNLEGAISSIAQQLPLLVAGVGAASQAIPLAGMAMQSFGQEYSDGKAQGLDTAQAGTRAAAFAAFEVIGERFGLRAQMDALKGAARGMPTSEIFKFMAESLKKEIPGELLTTTGQFAVDKWAPAGMALNPNATMEDYLKQVADTIAQTIMQGGIMTGGTTGVSSAVRFAQDKGPTAGQIEAGANTARDRALNAWETNGLSAGAQPGAQAAPRVEPTLTPHQTVQDADQIVRELAEQAGVPLETVLPESVLAPAALVDAQPQVPAVESAPAATQAQGQFSDNDVLAFAEARYRTLRDKAEGGVSLVPGDDGMVEQETPGVALNEAEQRELDALAQAGKNPAALRAMYGFDNQRTEVADATPAESAADREARLEREAIQAEGPASTEVQTDDDIPGFGDVQANGIAPRDEKNGKAQGGSKAVFDEVDKAGRVESDAWLAEISAKQKAGEKVDWKYYQDKQYNAIQAAITYRAQEVAAAIVANADQNGIATLRRAMKRGDELLLANVVDMVNTPNAGAIMTNPDVKAAVLDILRKQYPNDAPAQDAGTATEGAGVSQPTQVQPKPRAGAGHAKSVANYKVDTEDSGSFGVRVNRLNDGGVLLISNDGSPVIEHNAAFSDGKTDEELIRYSFEPLGVRGLSKTETDAPKPRTEKEARAQKDYGDKWFGSADKAQAFIAKHGIGESHEVAQDGKKFTIKKKGTPNGTQATQAQQAGAQQQEAGDQGSDAQAGAGTQGPGVPATGRTDVQADGLKGAAPGTRLNGEADRAAADRLEKLIEQIPPNALPRAAGAKMILRSVVEQLRKPRTAISVEEMLENASERLYADKYVPQAEVVIDVLDAIDQRNGQQDELDAEMRGYEDKASGKSEQEPTGLVVIPADADDFDAMFDDVLAEELAKDEAKKPVKPKTEKEAKAKRAEAAVREMTEEGRAKDGKPINGGDVFRTLSGRTTTPYHKQKGERYASDWLIENAKAEAQARGDDFNTTGFGAVSKLKGGNLTPAYRDSMLMYLFGEQPAVVPSILKPLASAGKNSAAALANAIDGLGALFGGAGKLSSGFTFDEDTYAKAKPLFKEAVANLGEAGKDLREAMRAVVRLVLDKFGAQAAQNMKPYVVRFIEENSSTKGKDEETTTPATVQAEAIYTPEGKFKVAQQLADHLIGGGTFDTIVAARKMIGDIIGRKIDPATELAKQADETVEVAVVLAAREMIAAGRKQGRTPQVIYDRLLSLFKAQPNLAVRSSTSMRDQAYSTPVPLAYVASELAGVTADTKMIESTAGNGMLAIGASLANATVNELNPKRAAMLEAMGFKPTTENAATATLAPARSQDAVVINPPFGATKDSQGNTIVYEVKPNFGTREVDHAIVFKTLEAMKDDGRAVLIVGGVMSEADEARREDYRGKNKRMFYFNLYRDYNVVDHFTVDGALYAKQGASYPVDVIVINGRGKSSRDLPAAALPHIIRSYEELKEKLNAESSLGARGADGADVADSGTGGAGNPDDTQGVAGRPGASGGRVGAQGEKPSAGGAAGVRGAGSGRVNGQPQPGGAVPPAEQLEPQGVAGGVGDRQGTVRGEGAGKRGSTGSTGDERLPALGGPGIVSGERVQSGLTDRRGEEQETETQVAYTPQSGATSVGTLVPRAMKDAIEGSLQRIADEVGDLDQYVADSLAMDPETLRENFSAEQVDALALAIRNAEAGKGFIIGDQTGIGKGRVVAAMIRYALINDKTPVFVTEKPNLYSDMIRDLDDIGMTDDLGLDTENPRIFITNSDETIPYTLLRTEGDEVVENNLNLRPAKRGAALNDLMKSMMEGESLGDYKVIFTTYSQLQTVKGAETTRQKFVQQFGAGNYMIFDESHNAGGAGETQARTKEQRKAEKAGQSLVTGRAAFVRSLVTSAYGTFFSSATYAKRPDVMDLYSSTNMRLAVDKIADLGAAIKAGGVPMQQVVANMLTQDGQYIRRERTFAGVSYDTVPTSVDKQTAENMASAMRSILAFSRRKDALLAQMQKEADKEGAMLQAVGGAKTSIEGANFGAIMHNLIDQMLLALKVESSVKHAIERLKAGEKVVMTVSNTMGSFLKEYADEMGLNTGDVVGLSFGDLYQRYLEKQRIIKIKRPNGQPPEEKRLSDAELGPELTQMFNEIQTHIRNAGFGSAPISPIDYMHTELRKAGFATDEITGRTMVLNYVDGTPTLASRTANIKQRVNAVRGFNNGTVDVLILNQAGSTGLSLHAASKFKDQRKRHMIIVQAEKNIDTHMQMLGRVHRTGQVVTPAYSQMMADIPAEMRPAAVLLKKMASLNANTTASRKSAVTAEGVVDFMNDYGGQVVHEFLRDNPDVHSALGGGKVLKLLDEVEEATEDDIRKLTGYIPILPIAEQERIYADLIQRYNELIERENSLGTNKLEAKALDLDAETIKVQPLTEQKQDPSIFAAPANMELVDVKRTVKPFSSEELKAAVKERLGGQTNGAQIAAEMVKSLRERGQAFIDERMKKAEASDKADPVRLADQRMLLQMTLNRVATVLETFRIGQQVSVSDKNTGVLYGVITDIAPGGRTANPAAGSDWKMTIALANGDAKSITINFSQIGNRYQIKGESTVNWYNAETQQSEEMRVIDIFDKGVRVRREKRWIVTGNILAGFSKFKGQIITYTKKDGTVGQGVLMSRQFDFDKEIRGMKVGMRNVAAAMEFFKTAGMNSTIGTEDGNFKIMATRSQFSAMAPSAKRLGGSYYLDSDLTDAIGADFYKKGTNMVATVPDYRIAEVLDYLINTRGETLVALTHNDVARKLAGLDGADTGGNTKSEGVKFNAQDSADGYTWGNEKQQASQSTPQKTERSARNIRQLHGGVVAYLRDRGQSVDDRVQPYVAVDVPAAQAIREIAKTFGIEVQWFDLAEGLTPEQKRQFGGFNGANYKGVQYLRATGVTRPHLAILGHEVAHQLRRDHPDLYDEFVDAVNRYIKPGEYKKFLALPVAKAKDPREEFSGEVLSDLFMERDFWNGLGAQNPSLLQRMVDLVVSLVDKLMNTVGYTKVSAPYLSDYRKVMEIAADVMTRYAGRQVKAGQGAQDGLSFNAQGQTNTESFRKWFGDSKVVDNEGTPLVVYHGTTADVTAFSDEFFGEGHGASDWGDGFYFTNNPKAANTYAEGQGGNVMPVYLSIKNPADRKVMMSAKVQAALEDDMGFTDVAEVLAGLGYDGIVIDHKGGDKEYIVFKPTQVKSAIGNNGQFDPNNEDIRFNAQDDKGSVPNIVRKVQNNLIQFFGSQSGRQLDTFNAYDKTIGSQYNKALKDKHFGRVYQLLLGMQNHVSMAAMRAAQMAPGVLPQVDDIKGAAKALFSKRKQGSLDSATRAIFMGTLAGENVMQGQVWTKGEFMGRFGNDETAWALYEQTRAAIDASLDEVAAAEAYSLAQKFLTKDMRAKVIAEPGGAEALILNHLEQQLNMARMAIVQAETTGDEQQANEMAAMRDAFKSTIRHVEAIFTTAKNLKAAGYAPLMRFGKYTVEAKFIDPMTGNVERDENGQPMTAFFGRFESEKEARKAEARLRVEFDGRDDVAITAGTYNSDRHELYTGVTPETLELFAEATGMGNMADEFIRLAKSDRSAMKRQLERKGTPGFSQDLPRVLSSFITSNARHAAQRLYMTSINQAVKRIPKEKGDVQQEAQKLRNFVLNPDDAGAISSSLMFAWFLGGSVAAAAVNLTQPLMVTLPYLTQFTSMAKASALLTKAMPAAFGKAEIRDKDLREGLERASLEGVVDAQEIFHLYSLGSHQLIKGNRGQAALTLWGSLFSGVEKINRRMTFIAAWNLAKETGEANPYAFAVRAVNQTQGIYNKVNRPNVSRTWAGRMVMTYKGYALMVGELMVRMWKAGPGGKKAVAIMLAMLFLAAGEEGLPMAKALDDLIDTIGQLLGFDTNMRRWKRRTAHEILGQAWGDVFLYGASSAMPLDFGARLGLGQMIPGTEILKPSSGIFNMRAIGEIIGPTAGAGGQIGDAAEASFEGNYGKAVQNASPKAVRDVLAAMEMATRGQATDARGRKVTDVGLGDAAVKAVGFQPTNVAQEHRKTMPIQQDIALQRKREASIVAKWARAAMDGDQKGVQEAIAERDAWNARNPDTPIVISKQQIMGRVKTMRADKDTRTFKTAPKEMRGRIGLDMLDD